MPWALRWRGIPLSGSCLVSHPFLILLRRSTLGFSFDSGTSKDHDYYGDAMSVLCIVRKEMNWGLGQTTVHMFEHVLQNIFETYSLCNKWDGSALERGDLFINKIAVINKIKAIVSGVH